MRVTAWFAPSMPLIATLVIACFALVIGRRRFPHGIRASAKYFSPMLAFILMVGAALIAGFGSFFYGRTWSVVASWLPPVMFAIVLLFALWRAEPRRADDKDAARPSSNVFRVIFVVSFGAFIVLAVLSRAIR